MYRDVLFLLPYLLSLALSLTIIGYVQKYRGIEAARFFSYKVIAESVLISGFLLETLGRSLPEKILWDNVQYVVDLALPGLTYLFVLSITRREVRSRAAPYLVLAAPLIGAALFATDSLHHLIRPTASLNLAPIFPELVYPFTTVQDALLGYILAFLLFNVGSLLAFSARAKGLTRRQTLITAVALVIPAAAGLLSAAGIQVGPYRDMSPVAFALQDLVVVVALARLALLDLVPVARDLAIDHLDTALLIEDLRHRVVDINRKGAEFVGLPLEKIIGRDTRDVFPYHRDLVEKIWDLEDAVFETDARRPRNTGIFFEVHISTVRDRTGRKIGRLFLLQDITTHKKLAAELRRTHEELASGLNEKLRVSEELYRQVFEKTSDGLFVVEVTPDMRYRLVSYNPAQERMLGVTSADAVGKYSDEYLPAAAVATVHEQNRLCIEAGTPVSFEAAIDLPAGRSHFHTTLVPVRDGSGRIHRIIGLARDMTETRRIEEALRLSEEKFSKAFHGSPDSITISDPDSGIYLEVNESFLATYGYTREQVIGRSSFPGGLNLWVDPGDREKLLARVRQEGAATGEAIPFRRRDGSIRYSQVAWSIIEIEGKKRLLAIARDITERRKMEEALKDSEARFRLLAENSTDMISRHTPEGVYLYVSPACTTLLGYRPEQLLGRSAYDLFHPEDLEAIRKSHDTIRQADTAYTVSYRIRRADGSWTWFEIVSRSIRDPGSGEVVEIQSASRDIAERHRAQERERENELALFQASKLASLGTLVSGIAHEINNPNNFIRLNSQNLREFWGDIRAALDADGGSLSLHGIPWETARGMVDELLHGIAEGSKRIEKLLLNLRDFARGDEGKLNQTVEMNAVVRSAVMIVKNLVQKSTNDFSVRETPSLPAVRGNYQQLEQVVINLVTNACQALPSRERKVSIETEIEAGGEAVMLRVADEGVGIPAENLPHVIDPFYTTRRQAGGSGLGLSVSSRIVQNHGGTMTFTSKVNAGTVVTVRIPASGPNP